MNTFLETKFFVRHNNNRIKPMFENKEIAKVVKKIISDVKEFTFYC